MKTTITNPTSIFINGQLTGSEVIHQVKSLIELNGIFEDQIAEYGKSYRYRVKEGFRQKGS